MASLAVGGSAYQINLLIDRTLSTSIIVGGLSIFEYGSRINDLIMGMSIIPMCTALFPKISKCSDSLEVFKEKINEAIFFFVQIMCPISALVMMYSSKIVKMIYYRGAFNEKALELTTDVVFFYSIGLLAFALRELLSKTFYALSDTKTPLYNASIGIVFNIILNILLSNIIGIGGLALATSLSAIITVLMMFKALNKRLGGLNIRNYVNPIIKVFIITILGISLSYLIYKIIIRWLNIEFVACGISIGCFIFGYIFLITKLKVFNYQGI